MTVTCCWGAPEPLTAIPPRPAVLEMKWARRRHAGTPTRHFAFAIEIGHVVVGESVKQSARGIWRTPPRNVIMS